MVKKIQRCVWNKFITIAGEEGLINLSLYAQTLNELREICAQYEEKNIFNCDETSFFINSNNQKHLYFLKMIELVVSLLKNV